jgi:hypothetical protein
LNPHPLELRRSISDELILNIQIAAGKGSALRDGESGKGLFCVIQPFRSKKKVFYFFSSPRCFSQKLQAGFDTGIIGKTFNVNAFTKNIPAIFID